MLLAMLVAADAVPPVRDNGYIEALRAADMRVAAIGHRLAVANAALCVDQQAQPGLLLHALSQYAPAYRSAIRSGFRFTRDIAVEGVVAGSTGAQSGIAADDQLVAIDGRELPLDLPSSAARPDTVRRDAAYAVIAALPRDRAVDVAVERAGQRLQLQMSPEVGCRARFEVTGDDNAGADSAIVQIGAGLLERFDDAALAVIIAHELSHIILRSEARLSAAGASFGLLSEVGKSGRLHRQAEREADRLSVYLLYNAGYAPLSAGQFWRGAGRRLDAGIFRSRKYADWRTRAAMLDTEAGMIPAQVARPFVPAMVALRDAPMR